MSRSCPWVKLGGTLVRNSRAPRERLHPEDEVVVVEPAGRALLGVPVRHQRLLADADGHAVVVEQKQGGALFAQVELRPVLDLQRYDRQLADQRRHVGLLPGGVIANQSMLKARRVPSGERSGSRYW